MSDVGQNHYIKAAYRHVENVAELKLFGKTLRNQNKIFSLGYLTIIVQPHYYKGL
jgi:hypothetical protein